MKKLVVIFVALLVSILLGIFYPKVFEIGDIKAIELNNSALIQQKISGMLEEAVDINKIYYQDNLIGVIYDKGIIDEAIQTVYESMFASTYPEITLKLNEDVYISQETSYFDYENKDQDIKEYLINNDLITIDAYKVTISSTDKENVIYVKSVDDFKNAFKMYILNFVSEETYNILNEGKIVPQIEEYGTKYMDVKIDEKIETIQSSAPASEIFMNEHDIFMYLCYGKDYELKYYTVKQFDTVEGVANINGLTVMQLLAINEDISDVDQVLTEGQKVNITYFSSPLTVTTYAQRLVQDPIYRETEHYIQDTTKPKDYYQVEIAGEDGYRDVLYTDIYVNGKLVSYKQESSVVVKEPVTEVIRIGTMYKKIKNDFDFCLPCDNAYIVCRYKCYAGHAGVDFKNRYKTYADVYAIEAGTIVWMGWDESGGNMMLVKVGDYYVTYCHFNKMPKFSVGDKIERHQYLGVMGSTGRAYSVHIHVAFYTSSSIEYENSIDACSFLPCEIARRN